MTIKGGIGNDPMSPFFTARRKSLIRGKGVHGMNGKNSLRTCRPDDADATRTVRIGLPPHVQERMRNLYGEPGSGGASARSDEASSGCVRTLAEWFARQIGR
jgi:hypothetical protein